MPERQDGCSGRDVGCVFRGEEDSVTKMMHALQNALPESHYENKSEQMRIHHTLLAFYDQ
jgi:hypothetical protein